MPTHPWSRRQFIGATLASFAGWPLRGFAAPAPAELLLSACDNVHGHHFVQACHLSGQIQWRLPLTYRAHAIALHPQQPLAAVFARRPGTVLSLMDYRRGVLLQQVDSVPERHFYGHGCFSHDGRYLYCSENAYEAERGVIGVYSVPDLVRQHEWSSYGIGPHEIVLHPQQPQLVVANGGILTHPDMPRRKLNLGSMAPSLAYIDTNSGALLQQFSLANPQSSIRHLTISRAGQVGVALQQQDKRVVPLVAFQQGRHALQVCHAPEAVWAAMRGYTASICFATDQPLAAVTCPRGQLVSFWHSDEQRYLGQVALKDAGGVVYHPEQQAFWVSSGFGEWLAIGVPDLQVRTRVALSQWRWDNHGTLALSGQGASYSFTDK